MIGAGRAVMLVVTGAIGLSDSTAVAAKSGKKDPTPKGNIGALFGPDAYPQAAMRAGEQGRVEAVLKVDARGRVEGCDVKVSSNSNALDLQTCELTKTMTFDPGRDADGKPVAGTYDLKVNWALPGDTGGPIEVGDGRPFNGSAFEIEWVTGPNGAVESCRVIEAKPAGTQPCEAYQVGRNMGPGFLRNGKPVRMIQRERHEYQTRFVDVP